MHLQDALAGFSRSKTLLRNESPAISEAFLVAEKKIVWSSLGNQRSLREFHTSVLQGGRCAQTVDDFNHVAFVTGSLTQEDCDSPLTQSDLQN